MDRAWTSALSLLSSRKLYSYQERCEAQGIRGCDQGRDGAETRVSGEEARALRQDCEINMISILVSLSFQP